jgi:hypothetical protein
VELPESFTAEEVGSALTQATISDETPTDQTEVVIRSLLVEPGKFRDARRIRSHSSLLIEQSTLCSQSF